MLDIERPTLDIGVPRFQMGAQPYESSSSSAPSHGRPGYPGPPASGGCGRPGARAETVPTSGIASPGHFLLVE